VVALTILYLSVARSTPKMDIPEIEGLDKIVHFLMYAALSFALSRDFYVQKTSFSSVKMVMWAVVLPILYGGLIEVLQENFFPPRSGDWYDWLADSLGVIVSFLLCRIFVPKFFKQESSFRCN
jgi:VanZ family protein